MTHENFVYWMQGYAEICGAAPTQDQWEIIKEHLQLCFNKVTTRGVPKDLKDYLSPSASSTPFITFTDKVNLDAAQSFNVVYSCHASC